MLDYLRIGLYIVSFIASAYALSGVDFSKIMRKGHTVQVQLVYVLLSFALAYLVAQFLLGLSVNYLM